jgi:hypothetical protein
MEVHAHTHTARKKWTHYFWEFLMLFLAVFCGFLAENQREHYIENQREKKFIITLLEDLTKDTIDFQININSWNKTISRIDTIKQELNKSPSERNPVLLYRNIAYMIGGSNFLYHDRTISQLKNAGNFRLIQNKAVADSLVDYDTRIVNFLMDVESRHEEDHRHLMGLQNQLFNSDFYILRSRPEQLDSVIKQNPAALDARKSKDDILFEYCNWLNMFKRRTQLKNSVQGQMLQKAANLLILAKREYHLK